MKQIRGLGHRERAPLTTGRTIRWARLYDACTWLLSLGRERAVREMTLDLARLETGQAVLDVGCGTGTLTVAAKARVGPAGEVVGIDAAPEMIEVARGKAAQAGVDVLFKVGLIEDIPFPEAAFDVVLSSLMIHHLPDDLKRRGAAEIGRVLRPGGRLLVVDLDPPFNRLTQALGTLLHDHATRQSEIRKLPAMLEEAGLTDVEVGRTSYQLLSFVRGRARMSPGQPDR
jgi:ubiquinone/menaquinone biosynthesis C-methylase UbiE